MIPVTPNWARLGLLGSLVFLLALISTLPASLAGNWIRKDKAQDITWQSLSGSIFDASVQGVTIKTGQGRVVTLDRLAIQNSILYLLTGRIVSNVSARIGESVIHSRLKFCVNRWVVDSLRGEIDLMNLSSFIPELELMGVRGMITLSDVGLEGIYHATPGNGHGEIDIYELRMAVVNTSASLGNYRLSISSIDQQNIKGKIETVSADSQLYINGELIVKSLENSIQIRGQGWAGKDAEQSVRELLPLLGRVENGKVQINWSSRL